MLCCILSRATTTLANTFTDRKLLGIKQRDTPTHQKTAYVRNVAGGDYLTSVHCYNTSWMFSPEESSWRQKPSILHNIYQGNNSSVQSVWVYVAICFLPVENMMILKTFRRLHRIVIMS